jgi:hypothetical protein
MPPSYGGGQDTEAMSSDPLSGCRAKLRHIDEKMTEIDQFVTGWWQNAYRLVSEPHADPASQVLKVVDVVEPPEKLVMLFAEAVYHMRSCLDQIMYQLVIHDGGVPSTQTQFPIFATENDFNTNGRRFYERRENGVKIPQLSQARFAELQRLQPYNDPEPLKHPLWVLNAVTPVDKHRILIETTIGQGSMISYLRTCNTGMTTIHSGPLKEGTVVMRLPAAQGVHGIHDQPHVRIRLLPTIFWGDGCGDAQGINAWKSLTQIKDFINKNVMDGNKLVNGLV